MLNDHPIGFSKTASQLEREVGISRQRIVVMASGIERAGRVIRRSKMTEGKHFKAERDRGKVKKYWFNDRIKILRGRVWLEGDGNGLRDQGLFDVVEEVACKPL